MTLDYWKECIAEAASQCDLTLTEEQLDCLAGSAESGHENYGLAFYQPPPSDRIQDIENKWRKKLTDQEADAHRQIDIIIRGAEVQSRSHRTTVYRLQERIQELEDQR